MKWHISNQFLQRQFWWFSLQRPWPEGQGAMSQVTCELVCVSLAQGSVTLEAMMSLMLNNERNIHVHILRVPYAGEDIRVWWLVETAQMEAWGSGMACVTPTVNPNVTNGLWVIILCHCRFASCNRSTLWWRKLITGEVVSAWGHRVYGNPPHFLFSFPKTEPKTTLKN